VWEQSPVPVVQVREAVAVRAKPLLTTALVHMWAGPPQQQVALLAAPAQALVAAQAELAPIAHNDYRNARQA